MKRITYDKWFNYYCGIDVATDNSDKSVINIFKINSDGVIECINKNNNT